MTKAEAALAKIERNRDQASRLNAQLADVRRAAGVIMVESLAKGIVTKTELAAAYRTSRAQIDKMVARAKVER